LALKEAKMPDANGGLSLDRPGRYEIRVPGRLDESWMEWFEGMTITCDGGGQDPTISTLVGVVADEAALQGLLDRLYALGLRLLSVKRTGPCAAVDEQGDA
jgi:hypothetical protein